MTFGMAALISRLAFVTIDNTASPLPALISHDGSLPCVADADRPPDVFGRRRRQSGRHGPVEPAGPQPASSHGRQAARNSASAAPSGPGQAGDLAVYVGWAVAPGDL